MVFSGIYDFCAKTMCGALLLTGSLYVSAMYLLIGLAFVADFTIKFVLHIA